jgi:hypothetical protein
MGEARKAWCVLAEVRWRWTSIVERLRAIMPVVVPPDASFLWNPEHRELFMFGLRLAARRGDLADGEGIAFALAAAYSRRTQ